MIILPLIGLLDTLRIEQMKQSLLKGIEDYKPAIAIIDLTGGESEHLEAIEQVEEIICLGHLKGVQVMLSGIPNSMAIHMLQSSYQWGNVPIFKDLPNALNHAQNQFIIFYRPFHCGFLFSANALEPS